ncbi:hypothetical protein THRCLA_07252 [Thraustotheca clavata]|uniref:RRM domain-containing protein n=1 Tax=Thraustotheca clavata TaxID=74557 RepID=A0A1V9ZF29_9STRA|nr:hypothetical protein THRCLA_07252 [Thraustotheca clavata]
MEKKTRVYVGQVPSWLLNEQALLSHFNKYGNVSKVVVHRDLMSYDAPGFGFLEFSSKDIALKAMEEINKECGNIGDKDTTMMFARMAMERGVPKVREDYSKTFQNTIVSQRFSQAVDEEDEDEQFLHTLSQRSMHSQRNIAFV